MLVEAPKGRIKKEVITLPWYNMNIVHTALFFANFVSELYYPEEIHFQNLLFWKGVYSGLLQGIRMFNAYETDRRSKFDERLQLLLLK